MVIKKIIPFQPLIVAISAELIPINERYAINMICK